MAHIITETMDTPLTLANARVFITNWEKIEKFFKKETLEEALKGFQIRDFATFEYIPVKNVGVYNDYIKRGYVCITPKPVSAPYKEYMDYKGKSWETTNYRLSYQFIVRDNYQIKESKVVTRALEIEYPYLKNFIYSFYHMTKTDGNEDLYLCVEENCTGKSYLGNKSVYVPLMALKEKNPQIIIDHHTSYFKDYYRKVGREKYLEASLALLETPIAKQFFECVKTTINPLTL